MGLFDIFTRATESSSETPSSNESLLNELQRVSVRGLGDDERDFDELRIEMERVMQRAENNIDGGTSVQFFYWLGKAYSAYTTWYIRGDDRQQYMTKAIHYYEEAFKMKDELPLVLNDHLLDSLSQFDVAGNLGSYLVQNKPVRDLNRAEQVLMFVYQNTKDYEPSLCPLVDLYYFNGLYEKSAEVARRLVELQEYSLEWKDSPAPYPAMAEAKAYRALRNEAKKWGDTVGAEDWSRKLLATGFATDNDEKIDTKLKMGL